jgi:hypothetical protein
MHTEGSAIAPRPSKARSPHIRSRTTNMPARMVVDGRTKSGRRIRDLAEIFAQRLGGWDALNDMELAAVRRAAEMVALAERARADALRGGRIDPDKLLRFEGAADRAVRRLGIGRKPERRPTLTEYLATRRGESTP